MKPYQPVSEGAMDREFNQNTICQTLRDTYHLVAEDGDKEKIKLNLRVAVRMAKAMNDKLRQYKADWDKDIWEGRRSP